MSALQDNPLFQQSAFIDGVWINGVLSYSEGQANGQRPGRFLARSGDLRKGFSSL